MNKFAYLTLIFCWLSTNLVAQVPNDECFNAIELTELNDWCSGQTEFTNDGASQSTEPVPSCFPQGDDIRDVWFTFVAEATDVNVSVVGATGGIGAGTIRRPQLGIYSGDCTNGLTEVQCISDAFNNNVVQTFAGPLIVGQRYYIRVAARLNIFGTFQLCINNFNQVPDPSSDCSSAVILCDKSPFTVQFINGAGQDPNETTQFDCENAGCPMTESSSSWYKWTCDQPGTLTFSLRPLNPIDDLDFIVFELPNGVNDCGGKDPLRCMASGENVGADPSEWEPCTGATGLQQGDPDDSETCGCQPGDNNFVREIDMVAGRSYAVMINNFSNSGAGFSMTFGGTGTFLGPTADFAASTETVCYGSSVTFTDQSTFVGPPGTYSWSFGPGATPASANTPGPHTVTWNSVGEKAVVLTVESVDGCRVTDIERIVVDSCCSTDNAISNTALVSDLLCPESTDGSIDISPVSNATITQFQWSTNDNSEDLNGLGAGTYTVTITNAATCDSVYTYTVDAPPEFDFDTLINMPTCMGGQDGALTLNVTGGTPPYQFNWGAGFIADNFLTNIPIGVYNVTVRDANGCERDLAIEVNELELVLDPNAPTVVSPLCYNTFDGSITLNVNNGLAPYSFDWDDGNGFVTRNTLTGLNSGIYSVTFQDANGCFGDTLIEINPPTPLSVVIDPVDISCFGADDGSAVPIVTGGTPGYTYAWSDPSGQTDSIAVGLAPGLITVTVTDANGCDTTASATTFEPPEVFIEIVEIIDALCFGESSGSITVEGSGGTPGYEYSTDGQFFQADPVFIDLASGDYTLTVRDAMGCTDSVMGSISQPLQLLVDAGPDTTINLGFSYIIPTTTLPFGRTVSFEWFPAEGLSCTDCPEPTAMPANTTTYTVVITDEDGCTATDEITIFVNKVRPIFIPNVFSPNQDGTNDGFTAFGGPAALEIEELRVFNRWGAVVFEGRNIPLNNESLGWDGTFKGQDAQVGVYVYYMFVRFLDDVSVLYEGDVTVVR